MKKLIIAGLAAAIPLSAVLAADADAPELKPYTRSGQYETCVVNNQIRELQILNERQILVKMYGKQTYLAETDNCPGLSKHLALSYDASINKLCNTTIVHMVDASSSVPERGTCGIRRFEKLSKN